ncbi:MAG: hypothetical protein GYA55_14190 [SAR324 cluster bacterium]|uniref:Uncharacterized protein n=1 Tax=SAR324 cluster bacterium TaxID=2024889 RepID=A0A7X9FU21_9DELT|nr:hypothetical protein [SAR324 cluster bacterium]
MFRHMQFVGSSLRFFFISSVFLLSFFTPFSIKADDNAPAFYPTWKLLSPAEKQQFVAGYILGWKDAARVTDIVITYVKENPGKAVEGLEQIKDLYNLGDIKPGLMASAVDEFFNSPENKNAGLSQAVSAAKRAIAGQ